MIRCALITTPDCCACRKIRVSRTEGIGPPSASRSRSTSPAPTEGSWSTSPTNSRCAPGATALTSLFARIRSSIDASSTTTRSASSGRSRSYAASPPGRSSSSRCTVEASTPVSSASRFAARPVGAASTTLARFASARVTIDFTVNDLPQPGPPVSTATRSVSASRTDCSCSGASSAPVFRASQPSAAGQSTSPNHGIRSVSARSSLSNWLAKEISARWNGTRYTAVIGSPAAPGTCSRTTPSAATSSARQSITSPTSTWSSFTPSAISRSSGR